MAHTLNIPTGGNLGAWAAELISACQSDVPARRQRGAVYRNMYLTGDEGGQPQTYKKTYTYIQTLKSMLFSSVDLRFTISPYGPSGPRERSMGRAGASVVHEYFRRGSVENVISDAVEWGLVKGKTFVQLEWSSRGVDGYMVQPETMAVLRPDINSLDRQDAFVHSSWLTEARFADLVANHPKRAELIRDVHKFGSGEGDRPGVGDNSRQVVIGGQIYPFKAQNSGSTSQGRGLVNWLQGPSPELDATTQASLIQVDELWVWDRTRDDWVTFQLVGDKLIEPTSQHRNIFAEGHENGRNGRKLLRGAKPDERNPLSGHHPFVEICPNPMPDYFWGWSEIANVAYIQVAINNRVDGINRLLRRQEDPSWMIHGVNSNAAQLRAKLRRPGGWHVENGPGSQVKVEKMTPDLPVGLWESLHEWVGVFDAMAGTPPVVQGQGDTGVRAQGHAETLVRLASTRFKDRALGVERQVEEVGGLVFDMLRAYLPDMHPYWIREAELGPFKGKELAPEIYEPPAPGMVALPFQMAQLDDRFKLTVDSHTASPIFAHEARELAMMLSQRGALSPEDLIRLTHPPAEDNLIADWETRQAAQAAYVAAHPEVLAKGKSKPRLG